MIIIDSSAVVALILREPEAGRVAQAIARARRTVLAAPTYLECCLVLTRKLGDQGVPVLDRFVEEQQLDVVPFTPAHAQAARAAFLRFGKGRHPAGLNFGDCMSYAVATTEDLPLLFVGNDFARTDVVPA